MPEINHTLYFHTGRLQKLMGKYVSFAMFLQHMALAVVFLHVFACAYLGHYGYETFGLDSNGHEYFYAQDTGGHLYYSAKVCNIRNLYNFKDSFSSYGYYGSSSYGEGDSSYSSYYSRRNLGGSYDAPSFYEVDAPVDEGQPMPVPVCTGVVVRLASLRRTYSM